MNDRELSAAEADGVLHIYGQEYWHDDAAIIGDRQGLTLLRDQIDRALSGGIRAATNDGCVFFQNDGEGFSLHIALATDEEMQALASAYSDPVICGAWTKDSSPYALIQRLANAVAANGDAKR